jgi:hypothetical protein
VDRLARAPGFYVRADTVVRWQRKRFRRFWARRSRVNQRDRGRPATAVEIRRLIEKGGEPEDFAIFRCRWLLRASSLHFAAATAGSRDLETEIRELNGQPALVFYDEGGGGSQLSCWPSQTIASTACSSMPISTPASLGTEKPAPLSVTIRDAVRSSIQRATR